MIGLIDSHTCSIVTAIVCLQQLKPFQHAVIAAAVELKIAAASDRARRSQTRPLRSTHPNRLRLQPERQLSLPHEHRGLFVRPVVGGWSRMTSPDRVVGLFDAIKRLSRPHF